MTLTHVFTLQHGLKIHLLLVLPRPATISYPLPIPIWNKVPWQGTSLGHQNEPSEHHVQAQRVCIASPRSPSTAGDIFQHLGLGSPLPNPAFWLSAKARGKVIWCPRKLELKSLFPEFLLLFGFSGCLGQLQAPIIE